MEYEVQQIALGVLAEIRSALDISGECLRDQQIDQARELLQGIGKDVNTLNGLLDVVGRMQQGGGIKSLRIGLKDHSPKRACFSAKFRIRLCFETFF